MIRLQTLCTALLISGSVAATGQPLVEWEVRLGGTADERASSIVETTDGYIVCGKTLSNNGDVTGHHGQNDAWLIKLDTAGTLVWQVALGGSNHDEANCVARTTDGGYIIAGSTVSNDGDVTGNHGEKDAWVVKLDNTGAISWQKTLGGSANDAAMYIRQTADNGYVVTGETASEDGDVTLHHGGSGSDIWVVKLDSLGAISWNKCIGGSEHDYSSYIEQTADGGYIVGGTTFGDVPGYHPNTLGSGVTTGDWLIAKLDAAGNIVWQKALGGANLITELIYRLRLMVDIWPADRLHPMMAMFRPATG